jgi:hypothetical protein
MKKRYSTPVVTASDVVRDTEFGFLTRFKPEAFTLIINTLP